MSKPNIDAQLVERIVKSKSFGRSGIYASLLQYLVECTASGNIPKEATIGAHLFGSNASKDYDGAKVRVYIFNLRKKLIKYFENEGISEAYVLTIPKGSYKVAYTERTATSSGSSLSKSQLTSLALLILLISSLAVILFLWQKKKAVEDSYSVIPKNEFWNEFIEDDKPVLVVLGDLFIFSEINSETEAVVTIRNPEINSFEAYKAFKEAQTSPELSYKELSYTYLIKNSVDWIESLTKLFFSYHKDFQTRVISRIDTKDLHDHNIIFIGMQKTAGPFNNYFLNSNFSFPHDTLLVYENKAKGIHEEFSPEGDPDKYHTDYGFVAKYPGPNNNTIFMFGGLWDTAVSQALRNFTDPTSIIQLEKQMKASFGKVPAHFEVLFEVNGIDRLEVGTKVVHMNKVTDSGSAWVK